jgi:pimeloyl-ACP methyl ester carboxylesterase
MKALAVRALGVLLMASALAAGLWHAPDRAAETLVARWAPPPSDFIDVGGQLVHLRDEGPRDDPQPVVLLHGLSSSLHTWQGWVAALKRQRRVITLDLPGHGLTGPWTGPYAGSSYQADTLARFVLQVLDARRVQRFVVGGNSAGGDVAWRLALLAPARVQRLVLVDAVGPAVEGGTLPLGWQIARLPVFGVLTEWLLPHAFVAQGLAEAYGHPERVTGELVDRYYELALREGNRHALREKLAAWRPGEGAERIAELKLPTLILWGRRDRLIPLKAGQEFAHRIAGSHLVVFDDLGHVPQEEDPARSVQPVREFLGLPQPD